MKPLLRFDFNGENHPFVFKDPIHIIIASSIDEVLPMLEKVQAATDEGYYAAGYISYEAAPAFDSAFQVHANPKMPLLWFGIFDSPVNESLPGREVFQLSEWHPQTNRDEYNSNIDKIKQYIEQGDTYQVNYTIRLKSAFEGNPAAYYQQLSKLQSANYSAYLDIGDFSILSASPELFFHLKNGKITTKPMKGTIERGETQIEDENNAEQLYQSEKNRSENVMIVDLLRNDLSSIAKPESVHVPELFSIEKYPTLYQMTSTITAETRDGTDITDIFKTLFPCGSITGAPKISTMNIINKLEPDPREVYCGAIGFITPEKEAIFNVPIRTVMIDNNTGVAAYGVGGGITWDSDNQEEYEEALTKSKVLNTPSEPFQLLETLGLENGTYFVWDNHFKRLQRSAAYFHFDIDIKLVKKKLLDYAEGHHPGRWKVRLLVSRNGEVTVEGSQITPFSKAVDVKLANRPISDDDPFLYHKTTNRKVYQKMHDPHPDVFDVLLWNKKQEVTEFTTGNIVIEWEGYLYTPPGSCGLLAGTFREKLLAEGNISERKIHIEELKNCSRIWLINSVRKWVDVTFS